MTGKVKVLSLLFVVAKVSALCSSHPAASRCTSQSDAKTEDLQSLAKSPRFAPSDWLRSKQWAHRCGPCPDEDDDANEASTVQDLFSDRREAAFAVLGTLWATTSLFLPASANAVYGTEPKMELPNMMENMANRASGQCLVESLGNRECLVWMDPSNKLYQGANAPKLLANIDACSVALAKIPELVQDKKWMAVKGIIAGPMGELLTTMNLLAPLSTQQPDSSSSLAKQVKLQLYAISAAVDKKDGALVLKSYQGATDALVAFVQSL